MQALKALVIFLGVLILAGMAVIAVTLYNRATDPERGFFRKTPESASAPISASTPASTPVRTPVPNAASTAGARAFAETRISTAAGSRVLGMTAAGDRLILRLALAGGGERLIVVDLVTGGVLGRIEVAPTR